ncbi:MAG TPA: ribosomal protein S18-alanine N-acetyltransferase [Gammaproteobacteria bacterium]
MTRQIFIRSADKNDLERLVEIENTCFTTDILSRRSFQRFIRHGAHDLKVAESNNEIVGYTLVLYRTGTGLARMYSIAVIPAQQGKGIARHLMEAAEQAGRERFCAFMRLEVNVNNVPAIHLYKKLGYRHIGMIENYYDDGSDALRMEKRIYAGLLHKNIVTPYYEQTTDFTCGPAALMMAMKILDPDYEMIRQEELQIWREATTIFMTSGHGGCSPHGLALSAWQRGYQVELYINQPGTPFLDGVRDPDKKAVIELVHQDFLTRIKDTDIQLHVEDFSPDKLMDSLRSENAIIALISTYRLNRNKAPHWVFVASADEHFVYVNDPDISDGAWQSETDYIQVPISIPEFINMSCFGQSRLRCLLILDKSNIVKKPAPQLAGK